LIEHSLTSGHHSYHFNLVGADIFSNNRQKVGGAFSKSKRNKSPVISFSDSYNMNRSLWQDLLRKVLSK
jgi:hypothetical protein